MKLANECLVKITPMFKSKKCWEIESKESLETSFEKWMF
jgi:hypothetical protein